MTSHPFEDDLTKLGIDALNIRYSELIKRFNIAKRLGMAQHILFQLNLMLEGIEFEKSRRLEIIDNNENPVVIDTDWERKDQK